MRHVIVTSQKSSRQWSYESLQRTRTEWVTETELSSIQGFISVSHLFLQIQSVPSQQDAGVAQFNSLSIRQTKVGWEKGFSIPDETIFPAKSITSDALEEGKPPTMPMHLTS